jgi:site-specific recombinase XerD
MNVDDCRAYAVFLEHVPPAWISRAKAQPLADGWAPFRGPLSVASRRLALTVLASFFDWLVAADYLPRNPWALINRKIADERARVAEQLDTRAFTPEAWACILGAIDAQPPSPARARMQFVLRFVEATGLRSAELVSARMEQLRRHRGGWVMAVHGKGGKSRVVAVPEQARLALEAYLVARRLPPMEHAPGDAPLLASTVDPMEGVTYSALYKTVRAWLRRAIDASQLQGRDRELALRASPHWLRHTFGTRAVERDVPLEVVQRQLGHADPRTTSRYSRAQLERLQAAMDRAFGGGKSA